MNVKNAYLTFISPSAEPVAKNSSPGSRAKHFIGESWAWNLCLSCLCLTSNIPDFMLRYLIVYATKVLTSHLRDYFFNIWNFNQSIKKEQVSTINIENFGSYKKWFK